MKQWMRTIWCWICAGSLAGCWAFAGKETPVERIPEEPKPTEAKTLDPGGVLMAHVEAIRALTETHSGMPCAEDSLLDSRSSLFQAWLDVFSRRSDGSKLKLALRLAEADHRNIPNAIAMLTPWVDQSPEYADIIAYHLGRMWEWHARDLTANEAHHAMTEARRAYQRVLERRTSPYYAYARASEVQTGLALGMDMRKNIDDFLAEYPDYPERMALEYARADLEFAHGIRENAIDQMQELAFWKPYDEVSKRAQSWLEERHLGDKTRSYDDLFARVDALRRMRFWDEADAAAADAMQAFPEDFPLKVQYARIAYERSDHAEGARRFESILEQMHGEPQGKLKPSGIIAYIYRAYAYMGMCDKALAFHAQNASKLSRIARLEATRDFALTCGDIETAYQTAQQLPLPRDPQGFWNFGFLAYLAGDNATARQYLAAAERELSGTYRRRAMYFLARVTQKMAQQNASIQDNGELSSKTGVHATEKSSSKKKAKKKPSPLDVKLSAPTQKEAQRLYHALIDADNADYYAILAHSRLAEQARNGEAPDKTLVLQAMNDEAPSQTSPIARPWDREYTFDEKKGLDTFAQNVARYAELFPGLKRVSFLHDAELYRERNAEFRIIAIEAMGIIRLPKRPTIKNLWTTKLSVDGHLVDNRRHDTGVWGRELDAFHFALPPVKDAKARAPIAKRQAAIYDAGLPLATFVQDTLLAFHDYYLGRRYVARRYAFNPDACGTQKGAPGCSVMYPHAFSNAVIQNAQKNHIEPDLIWALMNIESAFNPDSISHANAYGLLQIIPMTGYKIAHALEISPFGPYDLIKPEASITMGTWYFAQILRKFHGYATLSMAAYNGGPHQVARWLTAYSQHVEHDAFIELIPYDEARNYVKKGMARLLIMVRIDRQDPHAFFEIPNTLPPSFEPMPNY